MRKKRKGKVTASEGKFRGECTKCGTQLHLQGYTAEDVTVGTSAQCPNSECRAIMNLKNWEIINMGKPQTDVDARSPTNY